MVFGLYLIDVVSFQKSIFKKLINGMKDKSRCQLVDNLFNKELDKRISW